MFYVKGGFVVIDFTATIYANAIDMFNSGISDEEIRLGIAELFNEQDSDVFYGVLEKIDCERTNESDELGDIMDADEFLKYVSYDRSKATVDADLWRKEVNDCETVVIRLPCEFDVDAFCAKH